MKTWLDNLKTLISRYKTVSRRVDQIVSTWQVFKAFLFSAIMSLLIIALPLAAIINMFIYTKLILTLSILIVLLIMVFVMLYYKFYFILLGNYNEKVKDINTSYIYWVETTLINVIVLIFGIIVITTIL